MYFVAVTVKLAYLSLFFKEKKSMCEQENENCRMESSDTKPVLFCSPRYNDIASIALQDMFTTNIVFNAVEL